ncbi:mitochondrial 37S ribosomal protein uS17m [Ascoidea rubescens DSM 1968]|uniref:Nucleic acid-binding protein n=1 Tax=Ascoidea rubescens DSM 1968 TaxID=1344418 RepID=A0A1D2V8S8_9ASCO|nr:nucleic acid-binding protein [Ascoidea rubescens DSM 1968]ODV58086.1 nucleic acid-binding protein [Ascoidea rubescens DSM 1968]
MNKTVKVRVQQKVFNKKINKDTLTRKDFLVHDEGNICKEGDLVRIENCRPLSKRKSFAIAEIKDNTGTKFEKYQKLAKEKVEKEENLRTREFMRKRIEFQELSNENLSIIQQVDFIRNAEHIAKHGSPKAKEKLNLLAKLFNINPTKDSSLILFNIQTLKDRINEYKAEVLFKELMSDPIKRDQIIVKKGLEPDKLKKGILKNIVRTYAKKKILAQHYLGY